MPRTRLVVAGVVLAALLALAAPSPALASVTDDATTSLEASVHAHRAASKPAGTKQSHKKKSKKKKKSRKRKSRKRKSRKKKSSSQPAPVVQTCDPHWRGYVLPSDHNYAGIGAYNGSDRYMCKPIPQLGVRAQIQHLRNYADASSRSTNLGAPFEPRVKYDAHAFDTFPYKGKAPRWNDLEGKWAVPGTQYWDVIGSIYNSMRKAAGIGKLSSSQLANLTMMGPSALTAEQVAAYVHSVGNRWKPEISPLTMAQIYIFEGNLAGIRGDVAFCQSILETGWFGWPSSPAAATTERAPDTTSSSTTTSSTTTTSTTPGTTPDSTTGTTTTGPPSSSTSSTTTSTTTTTTAPASELDPVLAAYFELLASTTARN